MQHPDQGQQRRHATHSSKVLPDEHTSVFAMPLASPTFRPRARARARLSISERIWPSPSDK